MAAVVSRCPLLAPRQGPVTTTTPSADSGSTSIHSISDGAIRKRTRRQKIHNQLREKMPQRCRYNNRGGEHVRNCPAPATEGHNKIVNVTRTGISRAVSMAGSEVYGFFRSYRQTTPSEIDNWFHCWNNYTMKK